MRAVTFVLPRLFGAIAIGFGAGAILIGMFTLLDLAKAAGAMPWLK